ncbi:MAG TPA: hypothetical protein DC053_08045 [Lachnoclostridium sp.]|nr:hypothetical protein [Lachnoclostridium sp.]
MGSEYKNVRPMVINAFNQAYGKELPKPGLIVHTDQGTQYTDGSFQYLLKARKSIHIESRKRNPYDNAIMESFYRTIKRKLIQDARYETPEQAQNYIFKYIEIYCNTKRIYFALGYITPAQFVK